MTKFLTAGTRLPPYLMFPRFLLAYDLPETAKLLYILLYDRARLSMKNGEWSDENGRIFVYFTIRDMAEELNKSEMTIKSDLKALEDAGLVFRRRQGLGHPNRIYIKIPSETENQGEGNAIPRQTENCPSDGQKTVSLTDRKLSTNKKEISNNNSSIRGSNSPPGFGTYQNVYLTEDEYTDLQKSVPDCDHYIERLSTYMKSSGRSYQNHAATIKNWAQRDRGSTYADRSYEYKEGESL